MKCWVRESNYSNCTGRSSKNICRPSSSEGAQEKWKTRWNSITTKIHGILGSSPLLVYFLCRFLFNFTPFMTKLRVLVFFLPHAHPSLAYPSTFRLPTYAPKRPTLSPTHLLTYLPTRPPNYLPTNVATAENDIQGAQKRGYCNYIGFCLL
jgi:hypothetical protein